MSPKPPPREQFIQAGHRLLSQVDLVELVRSLSISAVVDGAGLSHQTFHNTYPGSSRDGGSGGKEAFVADLLENLTVNYTGTAPAEHTGDVRAAAAPVSELFENLTSGLMRRRVIATLLAADHKGARKAVTPEFERMDADLRAMVEQAVRTQGGSLRRPLTLASLTIVLGAVLDGLALREMLTPGSVSGDEIAEATTSILRWAIDPLHSDRDGVELEPVEPVEPVDGSTAVRPDLEADVIAATEILFADNGYFLVTLADIAAAAGIRVDDLRRLFPSKVDIIVAALTPEFERIVRLRRADERLGIEPTVALRRTLTAMAEFVIGNRAMSAGMLLALSFEHFQGPNTVTTVMDNLNLPSTVVPILERGRDSGRFTREVTPHDAAVMLTNNVLFRCLTRPNDSAVEIVDGVLLLLLPGIETRTP